MTPYDPSFGELPYSILGREQIIGNIRFAFESNLSDPYRTVLFSGARGIGKMVLLESLAKNLNEKSLSYGNLKMYRQFFQTYPQIAHVIPAFLQKNGLLQIRQSLIGELQNNENKSIK